MERVLTRARRPLAIVCAFAISCMLVPTHAWAEDRGSSSSSNPTTLRTSVDRAAVAESQRLARQHARHNANAQTQAPSPGESELASGSFFKKPVGIAVLAALGAGVGYALYSTSNDRIRSTGR